MSDNNKLNVFLVDRKTVVIVESNKFTKKTVGLNDDKSGLLGLTTYSNSESTLTSYPTIFHTLCIKSEFATPK